MANKTAMQAMIEWGDKMMLEHPMKTLSFAEAIDKAAELLEMEKEQIEDAHYEGQCDNTEGYPKYIAQQYYNETYGNQTDSR